MPDPSPPRDIAQSGRRLSPELPAATLLVEAERIPIGADGLSIGRRSGNDVVLKTELASRHHARISADERGYSVTDLESLNGTYLNGERLRGASRRLRSGDVISIGGQRLRFVTGEETKFGRPQLSPTRTYTVRVTGARLSIGRDRSNDVVLDDPNVSRFHAEVRPDGSQLEVRDLGSRNGTRVDGGLIDRARIDTGSEIGIGPFRLVFDGTRLVTRSDHGALHLEADGIRVTVRGKQILALTSLTVAPGELVAIIGESGSGKTTLLKALAGVSRPTDGTVAVNGEPVRNRLTDIGYVPQHEIVHGKLTVLESLRYSGRLRLPPDVTSAEVDPIVDRVLKEVDLKEHADTRIEWLSGGQRKRAGVATELLSRPSLLFLDEPTSGLDPGLESRMMALLRNLANRGRAVAVVTHATKNLQTCDKLAVMGRGGELCFFGSPQTALDFFGVGNYDDIYTALERTSPAVWRSRYEQTTVRMTAVRGANARALGPEPAAAAERGRTGPQARILAHRYARIFLRDRRNIAILLGQVPLLALGMVGLFKADLFSRATGQPGNGAQLLFLLVTTAIWLGSIDAAREIVKEKSVFARERAVGVKLGAYLASKAGVLFVLAAVQTLLLLAIVLALRPLHEPPQAYVEIGVIVTITAVVAVGMGLLVSSAVRTQDQATSFIPLVLIPQLFFAGAIVPVARMGEPVAALSSAIFAKWSFAGLGAAADLNSWIARPSKVSQDVEKNYGLHFFDLESWLVCMVLFLFLAAFLAGTAALLQRKTE